MRFGCIADDYTGATDVAAALSRAGVATALRFGEPSPGSAPPDVDAVVVGLKIRTVPAADAVAAASVARRWLGDAGAERLYHKVCSTFDSTERGNIGPVADALRAQTDTRLAVVCPAAPEHGRTVYQGHLFVGSQLLSETSMRDHPLTPMRDSSVVRTLASQTEARVELVAHDEVRKGPDALAAQLAALREDGVGYAVVDALTEDDLGTIAAAVESAVVTGSAGLAPHVARVAGLADAAAARPVRLPDGQTAVLAGSCSSATLAQVARASQFMPSFKLEVEPSANEDALVAEVRSWLDDTLPSAPGVLIYSSAPPEARSDCAAPLVERVFARVAAELVDRGVRRIVVAGGETSGAVLDSVGIDTCALGREEARGVPWLVGSNGDGLALLLKSGNFGDADLFLRAVEASG